ncbi:ClbS/DfsB family four-helix bundle protein [Sulfitobacter sp. S190]|nr:ClbS/DfsB family four-helix bundle protein [Sulfitobacter sp. S190]
MSWEDARALLENRHHALIGFLSAASEGALYAGPMKGANNNWTPGRWAEAAGPSHYRSAAKFVRSVLRANSKSRGVRSATMRERRHAATRKHGL